MKNEPLVSVIVPVYNVEQYVDECLNSIKNQSYKNIEVLMINDGSTDNSVNICKEYEKKDRRFKLYNKKNGGLSDARNYGLNKMSGDYVCFVDGDDFIHIDFIKTLQKLITTDNGILISCCKYKRFSPNDNLSPINNKQDISYSIVDSERYLIKTLYQHNQTAYTVSACTKMYDKNIFKNTIFPLNALFEDFAVIDTLLRKTKKIALIDQDMYFYRTANNSITTSSFSKNKMIIFKHCDDIEKRNRDDKEILKALNVMRFTRGYELLLMRDDNKEKTNEIENQIWTTIKATRFSTITSACRIRIKISALLSFLGKSLSVSIFNIMRRQSC